MNFHLQIFMGYFKLCEENNLNEGCELSLGRAAGYMYCSLFLGNSCQNKPTLRLETLHSQTALHSRTKANKTDHRMAASYQCSLTWPHRKWAVCL